ncbi:MAG: hypothetical protein ACOYXT_01150 [Bacteroidota bacterium]
MSFYLRTSKYNVNNMNFPVGGGDYLKIQEFLNIAEIEVELSKLKPRGLFDRLAHTFQKHDQTDCLVIEKISDCDKLMINLVNGKLAIKSNQGETKILTVDF